MERDQFLLREQPVFRLHLLKGKRQTRSVSQVWPHAAQETPNHGAQRGTPEVPQRTAFLLACESTNPNDLGDRDFIHLDLISLTTHASPITTFHFMESKAIKYLPELTTQDPKFDSQSTNLGPSVSMSVKAGFTPLEWTQKFQFKPP